MGFIQPTGDLLKANSPIIFGHSLAAGNLQTLQFEVFVWSGIEGARPNDPVYTIARQSGFVDGKPYIIDLSPIVKTYIKTTPALDFDANAAMLNSPDESVLWMQVRYTVTSSIGSEDETAVLSDAFLINKGYSLFTDGVNKDTDEILMIPNRELLLDEYTPFLLPINCSSLSSGQTIVVNYIAEGVTQHSLTLGYLTESEQKVRYVAAGFNNVQNYFVDQSQNYDFASNDRFDIEILDPSGVRAAYVKVYKEQRGKYTPSALAYLNRFGAWDMIVFHKARHEDFEASNSQYQGFIGTVSATGLSYGQDEASYRTFNAVSREKWTLNTGYVTEATGEALKDLAMSEKVLLLDNFSELTTGSGANKEYILGNNTYAVLVDSKSFRVQKHINEKLVNYTVQVSSANNWNNTII